MASGGAGGSSGGLGRATLGISASALLAASSLGGTAQSSTPTNPFMLPSDDMIFRQREIERKKKAEVRQLLILLLVPDNHSLDL